MSISWHERKKTTIVQWSVVHNFSLVIINLHPQGKGQESCVRSNLDYYQAIFSTAFTFDYLLEKPPYLNVDVVIKKSLFLPSVLKWRNTRKRKPWTLSFIEEAWICRTGPIFQRFLVKRRQVWSDREMRLTLERRKKKKTRKNTAAPMHTKIEKPRKTFWKYFFWIYLPKRVFKASYRNFRFF